MSRRKTNKLQVTNDNQILLEPGKYKTLQENLDAQNVKLQIKGFSPNTPIASGIDTRSAIAKDLLKSQTNFMDLLKKNDPTQIPFLTTSIGNILVNPSTISLSTLMKVAQNEVVAKCLDTNVISILNSMGDIMHEDKEIQQMLRYNIENSNGGLRRLVENIITAQWSGFSLNYIRDEIDDEGNTVFKQLDLLPPSTVLFSATARGDIENIYMYIFSYPYANTQNLFSFPFNFAGSGQDYPYDLNGVDPLASFGNVDYVLRTNILNTFGLISLDKEKCVHFVYDNMIKIVNPYGFNPLTRRVYDLVLMYDLYKDLHSTFLSYKASPLLVGYAKSNQTVDVPNQPGHTMSAIDGLYQSMSNMGFNGALLLSGLKDELYRIDAIQSQGDAKVFEDALTWYENQIKECLGHLDITDSSFASATTQTSIYGRFTSDRKDKIAHTITYTIFKYLIHKNFGEHITDYGRFENKIQNIDDQLKQMKMLLESSSNKGFYPNIIKKDNDHQRLSCNQPLLTDEEFKEAKEQIAKLENPEPSHPMDNSKRAPSKESKEHYKHGANHGV